ncbi:MAG: pilus assembly PilX family protein [Burkholderiaceae bacterium]
MIAMVMLAVIGLVSAAMMRGATLSSQVANNGRLLTQAGQYAQVALRFCELQLTLPAATRAVAPWPSGPSPAWAQRTDWTGGGATPAHTLAAPEINAAVAPRVPPQCLVEATAVPAIYTVTARGFSADFVADPSTGAPRNGAVVWLQSTVLLDRPAAGAHAARPHAAAVGAGHSATPGPLVPTTSRPPAALPPPVASSPTGRAAGPPNEPPTDPCAGDCRPTIVQRVWQQLLTPPF